MQIHLAMLQKVANLTAHPKLECWTAPLGKSNRDVRMSKGSLLYKGFRAFPQI
jgi:hypothetical protein